jgi:hypothetical protein
MKSYSIPLYGVESLFTPIQQKTHHYYQGSDNVNYSPRDQAELVTLLWCGDRVCKLT